MISTVAWCRVSGISCWLGSVLDDFSVFVLNAVLDIVFGNSGVGVTGALSVAGLIESHSWSITCSSRSEKANYDTEALFALFAYCLVEAIIIPRFAISV